MKLRRGTDEAQDVLGSDGIVVDDLSKAYHAIAERAFQAPTPVLTRALRGRRPVNLEEEGVDEDDDDEPEETEEAEEPAEPASDGASVWALRHVSFRVPRGHAVALVGGSGSGKTTLLRILGGAVPPTSGRAILAGRPSPLISVSVQLMVKTYAPEDNVALAARLVGVGKRRLRPQLDRILDLAEVSTADRRLGISRVPYKLAVAAAVELGSDMLLLDDPFASAHGSFRDGVVDAIERKRAEGSTILLETRDREALRRLCDRAMWLDGGVVARMGAVGEVLAAYDASAAAERAAAPHARASAGFNETAAIVSGAAEADADGRVSMVVRLELARAAVTLQAGVGLERLDDGLGLWFEQPDPVICELPGFHRFQIVAHDVPPGRYVGTVQARVLEGGSEAAIARREAFELTVGAPASDTPGAAGATRWERGEASWLYEPEARGG